MLLKEFIGLMQSNRLIDLSIICLLVCVTILFFLFRSDSIHTIDYLGGDHRQVLRGHDFLSHPFAIAVFEDRVYWTDWRVNSIVRVIHESVFICSFVGRTNPIHCICFRRISGTAQMCRSSKEHLLNRSTFKFFIRPDNRKTPKILAAKTTVDVRTCVC